MIDLALLWLKAHWKDAGMVLLVILVLVCIKQQAELSACRADLAKPAPVQTQASQAGAKAVVVYRQVKGSPCPEVIVTTETTAAQSQTQTAAPKACPAPGPVGGLWLGPEWTDRGLMGDAEFQWGIAKASVGAGVGMWKLGLQARVWSF